MTIRDIKLLALTAAAFVGLFACSPVVEPDTVIDEQPEENVIPEEKPDVFSITLSTPETKTVFGEKAGDFYPKKWSVDDRISVNGKVSDPLTTEQGAGTSRATFTFETNGAPEAPYSVVYPASAYDSGKVTIPASQAYVENSFDPASDIILGYGTTADGIELHNAVAYLKIRLISGDYGNFGVSSIKLTAAGKMLNGAFAVGGGGTELTVPGSSANASEETITLNVDGVTSLNAEAKEFLIAVAPQTLAGGFTVTVTDPKGNTMDKTKASSATLTANKILAQPAFKFQEYVSIKTPDDLLDFADACSAGSDNYFVVEANIDMDGQVWPAAGTSDASGTAFKGVLDGGNGGTENGGFKISNLTSTTGAFINYAYTGSVIKNVTLDSSCSIGYSGDITANCYVGSLVGMTRGEVSYCFNRAPVTCTATSYSKPIYLGGIAGRLYRMGSIVHCYNYAAVSFNTSVEADDAAGEKFIGGIVGSLDRSNAGDEASINNCENSGAVSAAAFSCSSITHIAGVVGRICTANGASTKLTVTNLVNSGNVTVANSAQYNGKAILAAGLIGGVHGSGIASLAGEVDVQNSHVDNCTIQNGDYNNNTGYGEASHTGGFVGVARGVSSGQNVSFSTGCYVNNVSVICRRGYAGGFASWSQGTSFDGCSVTGSSIKGSLAQCWYAGGIVGLIKNSTINNCTVSLTKDPAYSLYTNGKNCTSGGIVGYANSGVSSISNCKAYVSLMYQNTASNEGYRGWIVGFSDGTLTINKCGLGGTYGNATPTITLDGENFESNIYGSSSTPVPTVGTGDDACYYWDGTI